jgi:hypothetical protein
MSRVMTKDKHQDNHTNTSNNTSDIVAQPSLTDEKNSSVLDTTIKEVKQEFKEWKLVKRRDLVRRLGKAFEAVISNPKDVCEEIKNCLQEEIAQKLISTRDIERYCLSKWKKNTKPKNDKLSFSKTSEQKLQQQIAPTQDGKSVITNETSGNTEVSDGVNHIHDPSEQDRISVDDNNEAHTSGTNHGELKEVRNDDEPKAKTVSADDSASQDIVNKLSSNSSDKQDCSQCVEFMIPKEKYRMVRDAMDKSKNAIFVKCDENGKFVWAEPDEDGNVQIQSDGVAFAEMKDK